MGVHFIVIFIYCDSVLLIFPAAEFLSIHPAPEEANDAPPRKKRNKVSAKIVSLKSLFHLVF